MDVKSEALAAMAAAQTARQEGRLVDAVMLARRAVAGCEPGLSRERAELRLLAAQCLSDLQLDAEAVADARQALDEALSGRDYPQLTRALSVLGSLLVRTGERDAGVTHLFEALARARDTNQRPAIRSALHNLVNALTHGVWDRPDALPTPAGDAVRVGSYTTQLMAEVHGETDPFRRLTMTMTGALGLMAAGDLINASQHLKHCLTEAESQGLTLLALKARANLAIACRLLGQLAEARQLLEPVLERSASLALPLMRINVLTELCMVCAALGDEAAAQQHDRLRQTMQREVDDRRQRDRSSLDQDQCALQLTLKELDASWNR